MSPRPAIDRDRRDWIEAIYQDHAGAVRNIARRLCGEDHADDVTQEVFTNLWRHPEQYDPARGSMRSFLLTVCRGKAIDSMRSDGARRARELAKAVAIREEAPDIDLPLLEREGRRGLDSCLDQLHVKEREAIEAAFFGRRSYRDAAIFLGQPEGTVKARIRSGLTRLRDLLPADATR